MIPFDHLETSLDGCKLIESSAGTGKTYAIAALYLRLLLERRLHVHEILVVTFTEAAAAELHSRIRRRLREALKAFEGELDASDEFLAGLVAQREKAAHAILAEAIYSFDQAAIHTIHGFCRKSLQENAFESSSPFDTELLMEQRHYCEQIAHDFWRANIYRSSMELAKQALDKKLLNDLLYLIETSISHPSLKVIPDGLKPDLRAVEEMELRATQAKEALAEIWSHSSRSIEEILTSHPGLKRNIYKEGKIGIRLRELEAYFASRLLLPKPEYLEKLCPTQLRDGTKSGHHAPGHEFFNAAEVLSRCLDDLDEKISQSLLALKSDFLRYGREELPKRKRQHNVRSFDDLLLDMSAALAGPGSQALRAALKGRYKAALIDEFQDTDPVQYRIFRAIFDEASSLFLIGDPKQAVYGFRGADVFAYMKAAEEVKDQFTLSKNRRSTPGLVGSINTIFERPTPFVFKEIRYLESESGRPAGEKGFTLIPEDCAAPLKIWFVRREDESSNTPINKGKAEAEIPDAVAGEIARLLNAGTEERAFIGDRQISPWDIAVLVRTNDQAQKMQLALRRRSVPSVIYGSGSVLDTDEAVEFARLLGAIADNGNEAKVRAALVTSILGGSGDELARLAEDDVAWNARLSAFSEYREMWAGLGFVRMARTLLAREGVRKRLLAYPDGERRLTNVLHCVELLQNAAVREKLGIEGLLKWFAAQLQKGTGDAEALQMRLETDERALKVITVHKSKGLEFPIVFCPYPWSALGTGSKEATYHDPNEKTVLVKDLGSADQPAHKSLEMQETLAEQCRLFYVALTRAKYRCYLCWGGVKDAGLTAPAYLFHYPNDSGSPDLADAVRSHFETLSDARLLEDLMGLERRANGTIEVVGMPPASTESYHRLDPATHDFDVRRFSGRIRRDWGTASFSSWTAGSSHADELPDHDALQPAQAVPATPIEQDDSAGTIRQFPRGTRAGSCLHAILQAIDFTDTGSLRFEMVVHEQLDTFGFKPEWREPVCRMLRTVLDTPLRGLDRPVVLGQLGKERRMTEMEFIIPLDPVTPHRLQEIFSAHPAAPVSPGFADQLGKLKFPAYQGMMKGFIDLVFEWEGRYYLVDWKSNYLGSAIEDYAPEALRKAMETSYYVLQYHLYSVALHRYLYRRLPGYSYERHFGGIFYIFLRGVDKAGGVESGVYRDRPPVGRIEMLNSLLSESFVEKRE